MTMAVPRPIVDALKKIPTLRETVCVLRATRRVAADVLYYSLTGKTHAARQLDMESREEAALRDLKTSPAVSERFQKMVELLPHHRYERILDLGCAEGHLTEQIIRRFPGAEVLGVEFIPLALERAKARCRTYPSVTFELLDVGKQDIPGVFDLIFCTGTLEFGPSVTRLNTIRDRILRALAPDGYLVLQTARRSPDFENRWWARRLAWGARAMHDRFRVDGMTLVAETLVCNEMHMLTLLRKNV